MPGFVTIDWTAELFYIFTGFIGFKAKALEKTADAVCSGVFLFVSDTNTGLSRRMSSRMSRRDGAADAPLCSFRSPSSRCTKPEKGVKRAGFNSPSVLKTRKAQTRTPKTPSREGCAFYPLSALFPAKYI